MKVTLRKSYLYAIAILVVLIPVVMGSLFILRRESDSPDETVEKCQMDDSLYYYGGEDGDVTVSVGSIWKLYSVQPVVEEVIEENDIQYLVGKLPDINNNCVKVKFIITGDLPIDDKSGFTNDFTLNYAGRDKKGIEGFREGIKIGEQINIKYLAAAPDSSQLTDEFCSQSGNKSEYYCALQRLHNDYLRYETIEELGPGNIDLYPVIYGANFNYDLRIISYE
ncbi:MAG: hypothetical protein QY318_03245 [Candidatus Dojkabacteria bacterium]|nr:MAG: hypothetical protein QY318_03245 [Candidatus Dojkabacteria bacterium]